MTTFESSVIIIQPVGKIYDFLADMNNHKQLMPDTILNWASTYNTASFNVQNLANLSLKAGHRQENKEITIVTAGKAPFDLELKWELFSEDDGTEAVLTISAELNMMLKIIASGPLQNLADHETQTLGDIFS